MTATDRHGYLPHDGIIDWVAVDIAAQGAREVRLTRPERAIANARRRNAGRHCGRPQSTVITVMGLMRIAGVVLLAGIGAAAAGFVVVIAVAQFLGGS